MSSTHRSWKLLPICSSNCSARAFSSAFPKRSFTLVSPSISLKAIHSALEMLGCVSATLRANSLTCCAACGGRLVERWGLHLYSPTATWRIRSKSRSIPCPERAEAPTTGMPKRRERALRLMSILFRLASSSRLTHSTALSVICKTCKIRFMLRSNRVASATITVTSGCPKRMKSRAISSSSEVDESE